MSSVDGLKLTAIAAGCLHLQLWPGLCAIWLFSMSHHFGIQANGASHLGYAILWAEIKKQEQASWISSCLEWACCHSCWHSLASQVHGEVWLWAVRCVLPCGNHGKQQRRVIVLQGREQIVANNHMSYPAIDKYFNVVPLFDLLFFLNSSSAEMQDADSCYIFYDRTEV